MSRLIKGFHFAWFCHVIFIFFLIPSNLKVKLVCKTKIMNYLSKFSIWNVCHDYHVNLCLTLHELFELPHGILTLNYVVHIHHYIQSQYWCLLLCLFVCPTNQTMLHSVHIQNFVKCVYHLCLHTYRYLYCQVNWILNCT